MKRVKYFTTLLDNGFCRLIKGSTNVTVSPALVNQNQLYKRNSSFKTIAWAPFKSQIFSNKTNLMAGCTQVGQWVLLKFIWIERTVIMLKK